MEGQIISKIKFAFIGLIIGSIATRAFIPRVETKEIVKYQKVVEKQQDKDKNKTVVIIEKKDPKGNVTKETTIKEDTKTTTNTVSKTTDNTANSKIASNSRVTLGVIAISELSKNILTKPLEYGIITEVPVYGSLSLTGLLTTEKKIGIGLTTQF